MSTEYVLLDQSQIEADARLEKYKSRLQTVLEKEIESFKFKESDNENITAKFDAAKTKIAGIIRRDLSPDTHDAMPICTVSRTKIYWETQMDELEKLMLEEGKFIVSGDDGSSYKSFATFKKVIDAAEKNM